MKKNFKLYALLLALGLGATRISFAPEEHLPEHAPAHEPERAPHESPEEIQKRHEKELKKQENIQKGEQEKLLADQKKDIKDLTNASKSKGQGSIPSQIKDAQERLEKKGIKFDDPTAKDSLKDQHDNQKEQLATNHEDQTTALKAKHEKEKAAAATKATDELGDAFEGLSKDNPEPSKSEEQTKEEQAKDNENEKPQEEAKPTEEPTAKEKATETANKKETIESTALVIKDILSSADDFNKEAGFDVIDPNEIKDLNKDLDEAKNATGKKYNSIMDYIDAILSDLMRILKNLTSSMSDSLKEHFDKLSAKLDTMKEKRAKEQAQKDKQPKKEPAASKPTESEEEPVKEKTEEEKAAEKQAAEEKAAKEKAAEKQAAKEKALDLLGLTGDPTWEEVKDAYKKLHPDKQLSKYKEQHPESQERLLEKTDDPTINKKNKEINEERAKRLNDFIAKSDEIFKSLPSLSDLKTMFS